jgi:hypothetical protein
MFDTINATKQQELDDANEAQDYRIAEGELRDYAGGEGGGGNSEDEYEAMDYDEDDGDYGGLMEEEEADAPVFKSAKKIMSSVADFLGGVKKSMAPSPRMMAKGAMRMESAKDMDMEMNVSDSKRPSNIRAQSGEGRPTRNNNNNNVNKPIEPPKPSSSPSSKEPTPQSKDENVAKDVDKAVLEEEELGEVVAFDYTKVPTTLERLFDELDTDGAVRPTIINTGETWTKREFKSLLAEGSTRTLDNDGLVIEKNRAFDLLDALTKSGALPIDYASLHVIIAATHCFDQSVMNTLIQDNINPIEKLERTSLIIAGTVHQQPMAELIKDEQIERVATYSPNILPDYVPKNEPLLALPASSSSASLLPVSMSSGKLKVKK